MTLFVFSLKVALPQGNLEAGFLALVSFEILELLLSDISRHDHQLKLSHSQEYMSDGMRSTDFTTAIFPFAEYVANTACEADGIGLLLCSKTKV